LQHILVEYPAEEADEPDRAGQTGGAGDDPAAALRRSSERHRGAAHFTRRRWPFAQHSAESIEENRLDRSATVVVRSSAASCEAQLWPRAANVSRNVEQQRKFEPG